MRDNNNIDPRSAVPCRTVAFTTDGKHLVEANYLGFITIRSTIDGSIVNRFLGQTALVETIRFEKRTGSLFLVGAGFEGYRDFGVAKIFDFPDGNRIGELRGHEDDITDIAFLEGVDRRIATVGLDKRVKVHNLSNPKSSWTWEGYTDYLNMVSYRPLHDGQFAIAGDSDFTYVLDANEKKTIAELLTPGDSNGLIWSPDGRYLIVGDDHADLHYFDSKSNWEKVSTTKLGGAVKKTVKDPLFDDRAVSACYDGKVWSFPLYPTGKVEDNFVVVERRKGLWGINVDVTKTHVSTPSFFDRAFLMKRNELGIAQEDIGNPPQPTYGANWVAISNTHDHIAITHDDGHIRLRKKDNGELINVFGGDTNSLFMGACFHPTLPLLATIDFYGEVWVYNWLTGKLNQKFEMPFGPGISVDYSLDGKFLAVGGYRWDGWVLPSDENGKLQKPIALEKPNKGVIKNIIFTEDNNVVTASGDGSVVFHEFNGTDWKVKKHLRTDPPMELCNGVAYSKVRNRIYSVSRDQTVRAFDAETGKNTLTGFSHTRSVKSVAVSDCGNYVVSGSYDRTILIWDADTLKPKLPPLRNANAGISCVRIHDNKVYSCSFDGVISAWDLKTGRPIWVKDSFDSFSNH